MLTVLGDRFHRQGFLNTLRNDWLQLVRISRLVHEAVDFAIPYRSDNSGEVPVTGQQKLDGMKGKFADPGQKFNAGHGGYALISDDHMNMLLLNDVQRGVAGVGRKH